jgi:hypothetical protein
MPAGLKPLPSLVVDLLVATELDHGLISMKDESTISL